MASLVIDYQDTEITDFYGIFSSLRVNDSKVLVGIIISRNFNSKREVWMENRSARWEHHHRCLQSPVVTRVYQIFIEEFRKAESIQSFNVQSVRNAPFQSYFPSLLAVLF
jgi:hypothetical protein